MTLKPHELTVPSSLINKHHFQATKMYWVGSPYVREGPEIALTFPFFNLPCVAMGNEQSFSLSISQATAPHEERMGRGGVRWWGNLRWKDGMSIWHRRGSSELCIAEMSKAATEKELSHQNFDIDKAILHTICVAFNTHQLLYHRLRDFLFLSLVNLFFIFSYSIFLYSIYLTIHTDMFYVCKTVYLDISISIFFSRKIWRMIQEIKWNNA